VVGREECLAGVVEGGGGWDIITISPLQEQAGVRLGPVGLTHMLNCGGAVLSCKPGAGSARLRPWVRGFLDWKWQGRALAGYGPPRMCAWGWGWGGGWGGGGAGGSCWASSTGCPKGALGGKQCLHCAARRGKVLPRRCRAHDSNTPPLLRSCCRVEAAAAGIAAAAAAVAVCRRR
jgi:hypothetical protein